MISMYTGTPGSGKSLHVAKKIYDRVTQKKNNTVIANFEIERKAIKDFKGHFYYLANNYLSPDFFYQYAVNKHVRKPDGKIVEGQTLIVIDECQIIFNSRDWNAKNRMDWVSFFTQHRKYGYHIILVTQFDRLVDRQIRSLVEYEIVHRNVSNFKTFGFLLGLLFGGNLFIAITKWYAAKEKMSQEYFVVRKKYTRIYDSYKIFEPRKAGNSKGAPPKLSKSL